MPALTESGPSPQPAKGFLAMRRISNRQVAIALAMSEVEVGRILNGVVRPTSRFRERLAKYLDEPEHTLFRDAA